MSASARAHVVTSTAAARNRRDTIRTFASDRASVGCCTAHHCRLITVGSRELPPNLVSHITKTELHRF